MLYEKIVVIDDDQRSRQSLELILKKQYEVISFRDAVEGLAFLRKPNTVSLAFVDVFMQGIDGISALQEIKKMNKGILVIIMTGFGSKELVLQALQNDADDFIEKPFDVEDVREKIKRLFSKKALLAEKMSAPERIRHFVTNNVESVSLKDVADQLFLSEKYVSRLFRKLNDCNFRDYKVTTKMNKAKELLVSGTLPIQQIARTLGYQNPETFMRVFKGKVGMTPLEYRRTHKK